MNNFRRYFFPILLGTFVALAVNAQTNPTPPMPHPHEDPPARVGTRYQYRCEKKWDERMYDPAVLKKLNEYGEQGWRLLSRPAGPPAMMFAYMDVYCFEKAY